jgi:hypothetical protein
VGAGAARGPDEHDAASRATAAVPSATTARRMTAWGTTCVTQAANHVGRLESGHPGERGPRGATCSAVLHSRTAGARVGALMAAVMVPTGAVGWSPRLPGPCPAAIGRTPVRAHRANDAVTVRLRSRIHVESPLAIPLSGLVGPPPGGRRKRGTLEESSTLDQDEQPR